MIAFQAPVEMWKELGRRSVELETSRSALIRQAIEMWLAAQPCPQCDAPTIPDPNRPGVRYCPKCQEPVLFQQEEAAGV